MKQLTFFQETEQLTFKLEKTNKQLNNVRRGLFKRHGELTKEISSLKDNLIKVLYLIHKGT
jgi:hypothetical protein